MYTVYDIDFHVFLTFSHFLVYGTRILAHRAMGPIWGPVDQKVQKNRGKLKNQGHKQFTCLIMNNKMHLLMQISAQTELSSPSYGRFMIFGFGGSIWAHTPTHGHTQPDDHKMAISRAKTVRF